MIKFFAKLKRLQSTPNAIERLSRTMPETEFKSLTSQILMMASTDSTVHLGRLLDIAG